jgi:hypothetical protein
MIKDQCGIVISVDTSNDIPDPIEVGRLYFIKDTGEIVGDLGSGRIEYGTSFNPKWYISGNVSAFTSAANGERFVPLVATSGDISSLSSNQIIIPDNGFYLMYFPGMVSPVAQTRMTSYIFNENNQLIGHNESRPEDNWGESVNASVFLTKNTKLRYMMWTSTATSMTISANFNQWNIIRLF